MTKGDKGKSSNSRPAPLPGGQGRGYQPHRVDKGYQPKPQGGHQPTTGHGAPAKPPNQGSGGKK